MNVFIINELELGSISDLIEIIAVKHETLLSPIDIHKQLKDISIFAFKLPERLIKFIMNYKLDENDAGVCIIKGFTVDNNKIGPTPNHWRDEKADERTMKYSLFLQLCSSILGDTVSWSTQQAGNIVHNIVPIVGDEYKQVGSGTLVELCWHTEEAFHPLRCDYLGLFCLRNSECAGTTFASINSCHIPDHEKQQLFNSQYTIYPDNAHITEAQAGGFRNKQMDAMLNQPEKMPVLFGDYNDPYLCIDPYYMDQNNDDPLAEIALKNIISEINRNIHSVVLESGDLLFIDNYRAVHGRKVFKADYSGVGRWLKRVNIVRDLRKSRAHREGFASRMIKIS